MRDPEFEKQIVAKAKEIIATKPEDWVVKTYYSVLVMPVELARKANVEGEHGRWFIQEVDDINKSQDMLKLVSLALIYNITIAADETPKDSIAFPEISETNLGFVHLNYIGVKKLIDTDNLDSIFPDDGFDKSLKDFEWLISRTIGRLYKKSPIWKQKLMWQLVKEWNSRQFNVGIGWAIRERLGEDEALALFRQTANKIMNDPELLKQAVKDYKDSNPFA